MMVRKLLAQLSTPAQETVAVPSKIYLSQEIHMSSDYNGSARHLENMARATQIALTTKLPCSHCNTLKMKSTIVKHEIACFDNPINYKECLECNKQVRNRDNRFCSSVCAAKYNNSRRVHSEETKRKISVAASKPRPYQKGKHPGGARVTCKVFIRQCSECTTWFTTSYKHKERKTCSDKCLEELKAFKSTPFRCLSIPFNHEGRTVYLQSTWEKRTAEFLDHNNIQWERPAPIYWTDDEGKKRRYHPDFYLNEYEVYLDPKNVYVQIADKRKIEIVSEQINLIVGTIDEILSYLNNMVEIMKS